MLILYIYITLLFFIYFLLQKEVKINIFNIGYDYQYFSQHFFNIVMLVFNTKTRDCHRTTPSKHICKNMKSMAPVTHTMVYFKRNISVVFGFPGERSEPGWGGKRLFFAIGGGPNRQHPPEFLAFSIDCQRVIHYSLLLYGAVSGRLRHPCRECLADETGCPKKNLTNQN